MAAEIVASLKRDLADLVLFLGAESEAKALLKELEKGSGTPKILMPGALLGGAVYDVASSMKDNVYLAYPTLPEDMKERGVRELARLQKRVDLPVTNFPAQVTAYSAALILSEGLRRSGSELSREKLIYNLEKMYEFDTGLTPLITYGPNRHIGALGSYIVTINPDKKGERDFMSSKKWVSLDGT